MAVAITSGAAIFKLNEEVRCITLTLSLSLTLTLTLALALALSLPYARRARPAKVEAPCTPGGGIQGARPAGGV